MAPRPSRIRIRNQSSSSRPRKARRSPSTSVSLPIVLPSSSSSSPPAVSSSPLSSPHISTSCPQSQARLMFYCLQRRTEFNPDASCSCGQPIMNHPITVADDPALMLDTVFKMNRDEGHRSRRNEINIADEEKEESKSILTTSNSTYNRIKMINQLSENSRIKGTFNPKEIFVQVFIQKYESILTGLAIDDKSIWTRLLPATLHSSIENELTWINNHITLVPNITWDEAKKLFIDHWKTPNSGLDLRKEWDNFRTE